MSLFASRLGPGVITLLVTAGLTLSSTPVEAASPRAAGKTAVRCATRHHVRHCGQLAPARRTASHHKPVARKPLMPLPTTVATTTAGAFRSPVAQEVALVNADRKAAGLPALVDTPALDGIATARAQDMVTNNYFGHYRPGHSTLAVLELLRANRVPFVWYGENIIWESGQPAASVASSFNTWWMNSPEHRANILSTHYRHIGIGVVVSGSRVYMVEDFTD
jgi:uncharacterized protein YkwD